MPPGPRFDPNRRWFQERPSEYPWEQDGLDHVKRLLPDAEPFRAWATFSFTAGSGRIHECDLLIAVPGGLHLVELKAHPGRVVNHGDTWSFSEPGRKWPRTLRNPLHLTDAKSKDLKSRLEWAANKLGINARLPRVEPSVFLTDPGLVSELDDVQRTRVYGRDDAAQGLPWIWKDLLSRPPQREQQRITQGFSRGILPRLMTEIGVRASSAHLRFGDGWYLDPSVLDAGPAWEDRLAKRRDPVKEFGRVRIYLTEQQAGEERRDQVDRAAKREYQVLQGIMHRGIAQPVQIRDHQGHPSILFRHDPTDLRLDSYLAVHTARLTPERRLDLVRQLAEAVRYAHSRSLYHRALAARSVYVSSHEDGSDPVLRVIDWQTAARDSDTTTSSSIGVSSLADDVVADASGPYLAPEFDTPYPDPGDLDLFGLGAISYLILTGEAPAPTRTGLIERVSADGGLHPSAVDASLSQVLDEIVYRATRGEVSERLDSADAFLLGLDETERSTVPPEPPRSDADPLTATVGQELDGWEVERILGTGSTARALLVQRLVDSADGVVLECKVLKVALDEDKAANLRAEAAVLDEVGGGTIVRKLGGPRELGGRTVVDLQYAGGDDLTAGTLGAQLREEGQLSYHDLERFGGDLFAALDQLAARGVRHRDIKPDNLAVFRRADRSRQLMLLDFSLAAALERDVTAGTQGYRDPFLGTARRPMFDDHAEWYAAAVTLHEMASQLKPVWGEDGTDPRMTEDPAPTLAADKFEPALRDGLVAFFERALAREVGRRFESLRQMETAWRTLFVAADNTAPTGGGPVDGTDPAEVAQARERSADVAALDTPLEAAGLSPRAVSVAASFGAATVDDLLDVAPSAITRARGTGAAVRKELIRRRKQWAALRTRPEIVVEGGGTVTVDDIVRLVTAPTSRKGSKRDEVALATLGLTAGLPPWPKQGEVAAAVGITQSAVSKHQQGVLERWAGMPILAGVREEMVELLRSAGRVMTAEELAIAVRARRGAAKGSWEDTARIALAVVRAAADAEVWAGENAEDDEASDPRLAVLRRSTVLVALESLAGTDDPSASELADFATALGDAADELAAADPLPSRNTVVRRLRDVVAPAGLALLTDTRLVALAAATSHRALASPRLEIYPRGLDLVTALKISQAAAGVRRKDPRARFRTGITVDALLARVRARFPEVDVPAGLTHVGMREALHAAGFRLDYDVADEAFYPEQPAGPIASSTSAPMRPLTAERHAGRTALERAVEHGGFVALTLRGKDLPGATETLAAAHPVRPVDVGALFIAEFRALASERGQEWGKVLAIDTKFTETGRISPGLASYVRTAWDGVGARIDEEAGPASVLLLHDAGLLARYADAGGHDLLVRLQGAARKPDTAPHGLWLLCPGESASASPTLDGVRVEAVDGSERIVLDVELLEQLRNRQGGAA